jgi:carboxyl-terminal processing protease
LQDIGRARIFGARTAGMVLASAVEKLPDGDGFQYVFASYRSAKGQVLEGRGVIPDVEAPPERGALLRGEDSALAAAVRWITEQKTTRDAGSPAARPGSR